MDSSKQQSLFHRVVDTFVPEPCDPFAGLEDQGFPPRWPELENLGLSPVQIEKRRSGLGGSDANVLMSGSSEAILSLWREKRGESPAPDLSTNLAVMLGQWTEAFNRQWFERIDGRKVNAAGIELVCPAHDWRRCTLDGIVGEGGTVWEAKHTNAFAKPDEILELYMPQLQHNMAVAACERAILSVIFGNHKFEVFEVAADWMYQRELLDAETAFWNSVLDGSEPVAPEPPPAPRPIGVREVCFEGNNSWASSAADWLEHKAAAKVHGAACSSIKSLVEADVSRAFGHGIEARRSKSGAISIREMAL